MAGLEIVWRNYKYVLHEYCWEALEKDGNRALYIVKELVCEGNQSYWSVRSDLEVVCGGHAA